MNILTSELLKYKRSFMSKLVVFSPLFFGLYALITAYVMSTSKLAQEAGNTSASWKGFLALVFNWWPLIFLTLGMALFSVLVAAQEKKAGEYRILCSRNIPVIQIWMGKIAGMAAITLASSFVLILVVIGSGLLIAEGAVPVNTILKAAILCWIGALPLIPLQLWASVYKGMFLGMGMGFTGMAAGVLLAPESLWFMCPWSYALRLMCPVIGIHPNGTYLLKGDALFQNNTILMGVLLSLTTFSLFTVVTGIWFARREVR